MIAAMVSAVSAQAFIPAVAVWAVLPGALATLTSEVGTDLGRQVLGEDFCGLDIMFGEKEHAHVCDMVLLGWVGSTIAVGLLLALDGSRFCTLIWGGGFMLNIAELILDVLWKGRSRNGSWIQGTHISIGARAPGGELGYSGSKDGDGALCGLRMG
jgi:hypothetical protein